MSWNSKYNRDTNILMHTNYTNIGIISIDSYISIDIMRQYELTCLISPELSLEELNSFREKMLSFVQAEKGLLIEQKEPVKKNLAYPIKKRRDGYLMTLDFQIGPENLESLEKKMKTENQILRCFLTAKKAPKTKEIAGKPLRFPKKTAAPKVELKEIEKKLEEILGNNI